MIWATVLVLIAYFGTDALKAFAGKVSVGSFMLSFAGLLNLTVKVSIAISGVSLAGWGIEIARHRATVKRLSRRNKKLEKQIDENRTSSGLRKNGTTRKEDL